VKKFYATHLPTHLAEFLNLKACTAFRTKNQFTPHLLSALPTDRTGILCELNLTFFIIEKGTSLLLIFCTRIILRHDYSLGEIINQKDAGWTEI
jgi:hypothetical protein